MKKVTFCLTILFVLACIQKGFSHTSKKEPNFKDSKYGKVISANATLRISSTSKDDHPENHLQLFQGKELNYAFCTAAEKNPWAIISLGKKMSISGIEIVNRKDDYPQAADRAATLKLSISDDGKTWTQIWTATSAKKVWKISLLDGLFPKYQARYLKLETTPSKPQPLNLSRVIVYGH